MPRCDEIDRRLIARLVEDVRTSSKQLAAATGMSESTVANRLRRLREERLLTATVLVDWQLAGYAASGFAFLRVEGGSARVAERLAGHPEVKSVVRTSGTSDVVVHVLCENAGRIRAVADEIGDIPGAASVSLAMVTEFHRIESRTIMLPVARWKPADLPHPALALDELDARLIEALSEDAHQSNREVARRLEVNESTIRGRLRRLEDCGFLRVVAMADPFVLGEAAGGYVGITARGSARVDVVKALLARADVPALASAIGTYDLVAFLVDRSVAQLAAAADEIRSIRGIRSVDVSLLTHSVFHRAHLTRLLRA